MHPCIALISPQNISRGSDRGGGSDEKLKPERSEMRETRVNNLFCSSKPTAVLIAPDNDTVTLLIEVASYAGVFRGARFVGRDEKRALLKTPAWEAIIEGGKEQTRNIITNHQNGGPQEM